MMPYPLEISNVRFGYNDHNVLEDISLCIQAGQVVGLIGPNGSGKSTLIKLSTGLCHPNQGTITVFGQSPLKWRKRELAKRIAYVPQISHLPPGFTVWESTMLGRTPYLGFLGMSREQDRRITRRALEWVDISKLAERKIGELSGGERQRVVLARALAQEPDCLLLDEPTTHLDLHHQVTILTLVRKLVTDRGLSALVVLHDLNLASTFTDHLLFLFDGKVIAQGSPEEVLCPELMHRIYGDNVATFPRPDNGGRPAVLPRNVPAATNPVPWDA